MAIIFTINSMYNLREEKEKKKEHHLESIAKEIQNEYLYFEL